MAEEHMCVCERTIIPSWSNCPFVLGSVACLRLSNASTLEKVLQALNFSTDISLVRKTPSKHLRELKEVIKKSGTECKFFVVPHSDEDDKSHELRVQVGSIRKSVSEVL